MHTKWIHWMAMVLGTTSALLAQATEGSGLALSQRGEAWARWQGRLSLNTAPTGLRIDPSRWSSSQSLRSLTLLGDYYVTGSLLGARQLGGLRATSGVFYGRPSQSFGGIGGRGFSVEARNVLGATGMPDAAAGDYATLPYLGLGYTGLSIKGGWGFTADLGVMALNPSPAVRLGRSQQSPSSGTDELAPVIHLGVSYSF